MLADAVAGDGTWANLILQAGSFGLLVYIVVFMTPSFIKEARAERESRDARFEALIHLLQEKFDNRDRGLMLAIDKQSDSWVEEIKRHTAEVLRAYRDNPCKYQPAGGSK